MNTQLRLLCATLAFVGIARFGYTDEQFPNFGAHYVSMDAPGFMYPTQEQVIGVIMCNTDPDPAHAWTYESGWKLGFLNPQDVPVWGAARVELHPGERVDVGQCHQFLVNLVAPTAPKMYNLQFRMLQEGEGWFGETSPNHPVAVGVTETAFNFLDFFKTKHPGIARGGSHLMANLESGPYYYTLKYSPLLRGKDVVVWNYEIHQLQPDGRITLNEDHGGNSYALYAGYGFSNGMWANRIVHVGDEWLAVGNRIQVYNGDCTTTGISSDPFVYRTKIVAHIPNYPAGGHLGTQDVLVLYYFNGQLEVYFYSREWGWIRWELHNLPTTLAGLRALNNHLPVPLMKGEWANALARARRNGSATDTVASWKTNATTIDRMRTAELGTPLQVSVFNEIVDPNTVEFPSLPYIPRPGTPCTAKADAKFIGVEGLPTTLIAGQPYTAWIEYENTGTLDWTPIQFGIGSQDPDNNVAWGTGRSMLGSRNYVRVGHRRRFPLDITAPWTLGLQKFNWRPLNENNWWFGQKADIWLNVVPPPW